MVEFYAPLAAPALTIGAFRVSGGRATCGPQRHLTWSIIAIMLKNNPPATWLFNIAMIITIAGGAALLLGGILTIPGVMPAAQSTVVSALLMSVGLTGISVGISVVVLYLAVAAIVTGVANAIREAAKQK